MSEASEQLVQGARVLRAEGEAIVALAERIATMPAFADAARAVYQCAGKVVLTGIGKAGVIGQKISATLASTGTLSIFLHPVEALHGDLGRLQRDDVVIALSNSGASEEIVRLLDHIKRRGTKLIAVTGRDDSALARHADITLCYGPIEEACPLGVAPSVSTTVMLALGDALALTVMEMRQFQPEDYAAFHPGGALGRKFLKVEEVMTFRQGERLSVVDDGLSLAEALRQAEKIERRTGAMLLIDGEGKLTGILTDADLRRKLVNADAAALLAQPVRDVMTKNPKRIGLGDLASQAEAMMNQYRIDELPVVDEAGRPVGVIDVQDLLGVKTIGE
ncbi:MAG: KpsF/GutQ family sugar-phosphate isomerase [Phycisphaerae bacterium]|nr:KpsF/GutQ family sugar-phosphate isomerase [Phycisphaerae bacterium]